jgi:hypothetical protein
MNNFKWKIIRFRRERKALRREREYGLNNFRYFVVPKRRPKRRFTKSILKRRRMYDRKMKKLAKANKYKRETKPWTAEQRQIIKDEYRWPGRFRFEETLEDKEYVEYMRKKYGIVVQEEIKTDEKLENEEEAVEEEATAGEDTKGKPKKE